MKQIIIRLQLILTALIFAGVSYADELPSFKVGTETYQITNQSPKLCKLVKSTNPTTALDIPASITNPNTGFEYEVEAIGENVLADGSIVANIMLPGTITTIEDNAFINTKVSLVLINTPSKLTTIGNSAFKDTPLLYINLESTEVKTIGNNAFCHTNLTSVTLNSIQSMGYCAFSGCDNLQEVTLIGELKTLAVQTFVNCMNLHYVNLPEGLNTIENQVFMGCTNLTDVYLSDEIKSIGIQAFYECENLVSIKLPKYLNSLGDAAFARCYKLGSIEIPSTLTDLPNNTFVRCDKLNSVTIHEGVTEIGSRAFAECTALEEITIPSTIEYIWYNAFKDCTSLATIHIGNCESLMICEYAFAGLTSLRDLYVDMSTQPALEDGYTEFDETPIDQCILHVKKSLVAAYEEGYPWNEFKSIEINDTEYELNDGEDYSMLTSRKLTKLTYNRKFSPNRLVPLYIPFSMSYNDWADQGLRVYRLNGFYEYDDNKDGTPDRASLEVLEVTATEGRLKPNHPYVIKSTHSVSKDITIELENVEIAASNENMIDCCTMETTYKFMGNYHSIDQVTLNYWDAYVMSAGSLKLPGASGLGAQRWFMTRESREGQLLPLLEEIKIFIQGEEDADVADAIRFVSMDGQTTMGGKTGNASTYNLMGQKVIPGRQQKGIIIKNGKKVVM